MGRKPAVVLVSVVVALTVGGCPFQDGATGDSLVRTDTQGASASAPAYIWSAALGHGFSPAVAAVARDGAGNAYLAGMEREYFTVPGQPTLSADDRDALLMKVAPGGAVTWAKLFGTRHDYGATFRDDEATGVTVDTAGDVILVGYHYADIDFGGGIVKASGYEDKHIFVAKLTPDASPIWVTELGTGVPLAVTTDASGNVVVTGWSRGYGVNPVLPRGNAEMNALVAELDPAGNLLWAKAVGGRDLTGGSGAPGNNNRGMAVACDAGGNVFATGRFEVSADFGTGPVLSTGNLDGYLAKLNPAGNALWVKRFGGGAFDGGTSLAVTAGGEVVLGGYFRGLMNLGGADLRDQSGNGTGFIARFDASGAHLWSRVLAPLTVVNQAGVSAVRLGDPGWLWLTGTAKGTVDFGLGAVTTTAGSDGKPGYDAFLVGLDPATGGTSFATLFAGSSDDADPPVLAVQGTELHLAGTFRYSVDLGGGPLSSPGYDHSVFLTEWATAPVVVAPADLTLEATGPAGAAATFAATARGAGGVLATTCVPASGSTFPLGTTPITCTATDGGGASGSAGFHVTVLDTTPPTLTLPPAMTAEATGPAGAAVAYAPAGAIDLVDGSVSAPCTPASGATFALGVSSVTCTATDAHGNAATARFTITVRDTTPPAFAGVPADMTAEATSLAGAVVAWTAPTATDLVSGPTTVDCVPPSGSTFSLGTTTVTCAAADRRFNRAVATFAVTVQDTTPPALALPVGLTVTATTAGGAVVAYDASASDVVDGELVPLCAPASGQLFAPGLTMVSCAVRDVAGNTSTGAFAVDVLFEWNGLHWPGDRDGCHDDGDGDGCERDGDGCRDADCGDCTGEVPIFTVGRTVPVWFELEGDSAGIPDLQARLFVARVVDGVPGALEPAASTPPAQPGNVFHHRACSGRYRFLLATAGLSAGSWSLIVDLGDGWLHHTAVVLRAPPGHP